MTALHFDFSAFGTYAFLAVRRPAALAPAAALARQVVADVDATCSRFRDDSDLSRANRRAGRWVDVDPLLVHAVAAACDAARATDGLVHPLLGRSLVQLGYDRDLAVLHEVADDPLLPPDPGPGVDDWRELGLDPTGRIRVPEGTALDLGSTAKAWAADLVVAAIEAELGESALVSLGGDLAIAAPDGAAWAVEVSELPRQPGTLVHLDRGGLATSSTRVRRWRRGGVERHHLLDPRTGLPAETPWRTVTATGPTCAAANTAATAAVVLGPEAPAWLAARGVTAQMVDTSGQAHAIGGWAA